MSKGFWTKGIFGIVIASMVAVLGSESPLFAQTTLCAIVKLEIQQKATLEREAFDAALTISNSVPQPLTNLQVLINFTDSNGNPATQSFFVSTSSLLNVNAVDGSGIIQSSTTATIHWLIIPSSGTGGTNPLGQQYGVTAVISGLSGGLPQSVNTFPAFITVHPQPVLSLQYVLPFEVFGQQPLLLPQITPVTPFPLGVRATNIGFGTANNFQINSAQPQIVENKQGLLVDFNLLDSVVNGVPVNPPSLLVNFGNLAPQGVGQASWEMTSSLAGFFIDFTSTFTHAADLGGQLTSLIQSVTTYTLVKDVLDDQPGHDTIPDFLVNRTFPRSQMQALLDSGSEPPPDVMLESDQPNPVPVVNVGGTLSGQLSGVNTSLVLTLSSGTGPGLWASFSTPFPNAGNLTLASVTRGDGKILNPHNFWISQHFNIHTLLYNFHLHVFDFTGANQQYVLNFSTGGLSIPPSAVGNLAAQTTGSGGQLALSWTAPNESGGNILGGQYLIETSTNPNTVFVSTAAQVVFSTNIIAGSSQTFTLGNLTGNATYFVVLFTGDSAGNVSPLSDVTMAYVLPNPPQSLAFLSVGASSAAVSFQTGKNLPPILNRILASTSSSGGPFVSSSAFLASSISSASLTGLSPATTYFFFGQAENPAIPALSQVSLLASTRTLGVSDLLPPRTSLAISTPSAPGGPSGSIFVSSRTPLNLSSIDDLLTFGDGKGFGVAFQQVLVDGVLRSTFTNPSPSVGQVFSSTFSLTADTDGLHVLSYFAQDTSGNRELLHIATVAVDNTPPVTRLAVDGTPALSTAVVIASTDSISFVAMDAGSGVSATFYSVDTSTFQVFGSAFSLTIGTHTVAFQSRDNLGNLETLKSVFATVRSSAAVPIILTLSPINGSTVTIATPLIVASYSSTGSVVNVNSVKLSLDGIDVTTRSVVTASSATFKPSTALSQGTHTVTASVADIAGNLATASSTFTINSIPPVTTLVIGTPQFSTTTVFIATITPLGFAVSKPAQTSYAIDSGSFTVFTVSFTLPVEGIHVIRYFSVDAFGNTESVHSSTVTVDATPPVTRILVNGVAASSTTLVLVSTDAISFQAMDAGSGVSTTFFSIDGLMQQVFVSTFSLAVGTHTVAFQSRDNVGNIETLKSIFATVRSPVTAPIVLSLTPVNGSTVTTATPLIVASYSSTGSVINVNSVKLALDGIDVTTRSVVTASSATFIPTSALSQGTHTAVASVSDLAGNKASASSTFLIDSIPPVTKLLVDGTSVTASSITVTSTDTFSFQATDSGTGVFETLFSIDRSTLQVFQSTFSLVLGTHTITFHSVDRAGNQETPKTEFVTVIVSSSPAFTITAAFNPATLNLKSQGKFVTAILESTGAETSANIDTRTIRIVAVNDVLLSSAIVSLSTPPAVLGDANGDGILDIQVAFDRSMLIMVLPAGTQDEITITGRFKDGTSFVTDAFIRVIGAPRTADPTFQLGQVDKFPFLIRGQNPTFHIEVGIADSVTIQIYPREWITVVKLIKEIILIDPPGVVDHGNGPVYAYEPAWDISGVPAGPYMCMITARKAGQPDIRVYRLLTIAQ